MMRMKWLFVLVGVAGCFGSGYGQASADSGQAPAKALVRLGLEAQGGEAKLRAVQTVRWEAMGYRNELEQSERPEGPYGTEFLTIKEEDDYVLGRSRRTVDTVVVAQGKSSATVVFSGGLTMFSDGANSAPGSPEMGRVALERMKLNPERLLLTALDADDLKLDADAMTHGVAQRVVTFELDGAAVRVYLNAYNHLPTAWEYAGPFSRDSYYNFLGDVTLRTSYGMWWLAKGGVHLPLQWTVEGNGMPDQMLVIGKLEINDTLDEASLTIPAAVRAEYKADTPAYDIEKTRLHTDSKSVVEIEPGLLLFPGSWNTTMVRQTDGVVILEGPISSGYSAQMLAEAARRFPGVPVKAVVTTSDSWPHIAGIREYVAAGVPVYALDLNRPILDRLVAGVRTTKPDRLAKEPKMPVYHLIAGKTVLGSGPNRMEIYPMRGATSERQMMVYFPEWKLLYGSDPFQKLPDGSYFYPQTVTELQAAVKREGLAPERFFMMHMGVTPWAELEPAVKKASERDTPDGKL